MVGKLTAKERGGPARMVIRTAAETIKKMVLKRRALPIDVPIMIFFLWGMHSKPYAIHNSIKIFK
jgi:hypothetical protein